LEFKSKLSKAALETLAIIIYRQPITRPKIDAIRGVNSDSVVKNLFNRGLITEVGREDSPGRPILYSSTPDFLHYFGINSLEEMPPIEEGEDEANQI
jgi:segregation and condensation protein B